MEGSGSQSEGELGARPEARSAPRDLAGAVTVVTGAASGIGRATAVELGAAGVRVVGGDLDARGGEDVCREIERAGGEATFIRCDVRDPASVRALVAGATERFGRLDIGVNAAGIGGALEETHAYSDDAWQEVIDVNLTGLFYSVREELRAMRPGRSGSIVNLASVLGAAGEARLPAYCAAKHGVIGLTRAAAIEVAPEGIRVNAVCPGYIDTPMNDDLGPPGSEEREQIAALHPMNRWGAPAEVVGAIARLCSPAASFVTGTSLFVDGGYSAR